MKLDLGCGQNKKEGFVGVDLFEAPGVDVVYDLFTFPWPWDSGTVTEVHCSHFFEHVPQKCRGRFMEELWRVMAVDAEAFFIVPAWNSERSVQDYTHEWPPICGASFLYFNESWRQANKLTHGAYDLNCNFEFSGGWFMNEAWASRAREVQEFGAAHYNNVQTDIWVRLTKKERLPC